MSSRPFAHLLCFASLAAIAAAAAACSDNTVDTNPLTPVSDAGPADATTSNDDAAVSSDAATAGDAQHDDDANGDDDMDGGNATDGSSAFDGSGATTTIAAARQGNVTTPITVNAIVTALHGAIPNDVSEWYIEDLAGGPYSGVVVYCDPDKTSCPSIRAPGRWTIVQITGSLSKYQGQLQFVPTAQTVLAMNGAPPPIPTVTMTDVAPSGMSPYQGVLVKLASGTTLHVDDVTPTALHDTSCTTVIAPDGGADAGRDAGSDGGLLSCSFRCSPPAYSGFTANDGHGAEVNVEASFFATDPLQSSPECTTESGVTPVTVGMTFSSMEGVLDYDGYAKQQQISPVTPADYTTP